MEQEATYVGIDVAKAQVDVAVRPTDDSWGVPHDQKGVRKLVSQMKALKPAMVLLEASGGLELSLVAALAAAALPVVVVNPRQVRDFARATGKLAKTDSLDAAVLAHFAEAVRPPVRPLRDTETQTSSQCHTEDVAECHPAHETESNLSGLQCPFQFRFQKPIARCLALLLRN